MVSPPQSHFTGLMIIMPSTAKCTLTILESAVQNSPTGKGQFKNATTTAFWKSRKANTVPVSFLGISFLFMWTSLCNTVSQISRNKKLFHGMMHQKCANWWEDFFLSSEAEKKSKSLLLCSSFQNIKPLGDKANSTKPFDEMKLILDDISYKKSTNQFDFLGQRSIPPSPENYQIIFIGLVGKSQSEVRET